ncbi:hypothetical protein DSM112329_04533 [Paraconexibacter sp. AEG42_29]|uniref:Mce/MlaD domain-containing protein n=1 Tax=Paraconexibacter sp. AEG42_29 TaxID=2997339 RepID=A0AAU7B0Y0_9ACTN
MSKQTRNGILSLVVVLAAVVLFAMSGSDDKYTVKAELVNAGGLRKNSSVKIHGVPAGVVKDLEVRDDDTAIATLEIDEGAWPLGKGAKVNVRPTDLLGERYAEIKGGDSSQPLSKGDTIPKKDTAQPVELDDVLNMLDADTRTRLGILINEVGVAFNGRGTDFNKLLAELPPSIEDTTKLLRQVRNENAAMKAGIKRADHVATLVNGRRDDLGNLIRQGSEALDVVAQKRQDLAGTIQNAPGTLVQLRSTLNNLDAAAIDLRPAAVDLRNTTAPLKKTLETIPDFAEDARPALDKAKAVSPALTRLAKGATPTVKALQPTMQNAKEQLDLASPLLAQLDRRAWNDLFYFINNLNLGLRDRDGIGHFIGAKLNIATEYIDNAIENFTNVDLNKPATKKKSADVTPETAPETPTTTETPQDQAAAPSDNPVKKLTDKLKETTDKVLPAVKAAGDQVGETVQNTLNGLVPGLGDRLKGKKQGATPTDTGSDAVRLFDYLMGQ